MRLSRAVLWGPVLLFTASCVVLPLPRVKPQVGPKRIARIEIGASSKKEVRTVLRKPTVEITEDIWVYSWFTRKFNLFVAVAGGAGGVGPVGVRHYRALVVFGPDDRVTEFALLTRPKDAAANMERRTPSRSAKLPIKRATGLQIELVRGSPRLLARCRYSDLCSWRLDAPENLRRWKHPGPGGSQKIALSAAGTIAAAGPSGTVLVGTEENHWRTLRPPGRGDVMTLAFSSDDTMLAVARRHTVSIFDVVSFRLIDVLDSAVPVTELQFSPEGSLLAASAFGVVQVFRVDTCTLLTSMPTPLVSAGVAFSPDGASLAVNGGSYVALYSVSDLVRGARSTAPKQVVLLPFGAGKTLTPFVYHRRLAYSGSSRYLAAVTEESVVILDLEASAARETLPHPDVFLYGLVFLGEDRLVTFSRSHSHEWVVSGANDSRIGTTVPW